jgi:TM2 domain-containing membrane protein YozV
VAYLSDSYLNHPDMGQGCEALRQLAFYHWDRQCYREATDLIEGHTERLGSGRCNLSAVLGLSYLLTGDWDAAHQTLQAEPGQDSIHFGDHLSDLRRLALEAVNLPRKSGVTAGVLSALIPGSGKIYVGKVGDGLFSLVTISFTVWQAIDGFDERGSRSTKGWIYGALSGGFYAGNVYGSVLAARQFNRMNRLRITRGAAGIAVEMRLYP